MVHRYDEENGIILYVILKFPSLFFGEDEMACGFL